MKNSLITALIIVLTVSFQANAQIKSGTKIPKGIKNSKKITVKKPANSQLMNQDLNYYQIEYNIKNNLKCYSINTTINAVDSKGQNYVGYGTSNIALNNSHFFIEKVRYTGNTTPRSSLDITIPPKTNLHANIDKNNILVSYYGALDSRDFKLKAVKIIRSKTNILITGSAKIRGTSFSVSISILQGDCVY